MHEEINNPRAQQANEIQVIIGNDRRFVVRIKSITVEYVGALFHDGWHDDFHPVKFRVVVAGPQFPPIVAFVVPGGSFFLKGFEVLCDGRIVVAEPVPRFGLASLLVGDAFGEQDQKFPGFRGRIPFHIPACQEGLDYLGAVRVFGDQSLARCVVDHKGFVQAGFDAVVDFAFDIVTQFDKAGAAQFVEQGLLGLGGQAPAGVVQAGHVHGMGGGVHLFFQVRGVQWEIQGFQFGGAEGLGGLARRVVQCFLRQEDAGVGGRLFKDGQVAEVHDFQQALSFEPAAQGFAVVGAHPFVGDDDPEAAFGLQ